MSLTDGEIEKLAEMVAEKVVKKLTSAYDFHPSQAEYVSELVLRKMEERAQISEIVAQLASAITNGEKERLRKLNEKAASEEPAVEDICLSEKTELLKV